MQEEIIKPKICLQDESNKVLFGKPDKYDYSKFTLDGFDLDEELMAKFNPVAQKLNLSQESLEMLLEIALEMSKKQRAIYEKDEQTRRIDEVAKYDEMFRQDNELPNLNSSEINKYMSLANSAYTNFCTPKLKELLENLGLNYHPELIKMFHKIGELAQEDGINYGGKPAIEELTPAQILYGPRD